MDVKKVDVVNEIASLTGLKLDAVKLVLDAYELVVLDKVLESQLSDDEVDLIELGIFSLDLSNYAKVKIEASDALSEKMHETLKTGRDFLSESVILKFNKDLLERYYAGDLESIFDSEPSIAMEDSDE